MEHIATPKVENVFLLDNLNPRNSTGMLQSQPVNP
jgi:hypothetical protein